MFESLRSVSDQQLLASIDRIVVENRKLTLRLLVHLNEIERRKLYLKRGYSSMFVYCTVHLRLSEPATVRRIRTARCVARIPALYGMLESGEVNLSTVSMVAKFLTPENADAIVSRIRGKSRREVERLIAELEPRAALPPDRVRTMVVPAAAAAPDPMTPIRFTVAGDGKKTSSDEPARDEDRRGGDYQGSPVATGTPALERRAVIQFSAGEDFLALVEQVRSLASHRLPPNATLEQVFALAMRHYVSDQDPRARHEQREARKSSAKSPARPVTAEQHEEAKSTHQVPARVRDHVFARDNGRCTYVGPGGRRCDSAHLLQIDHIRPVARGGAGTLDNLRLLCAQHNRLEAERLMGSARRSAPTAPPG